MYCKRRLQHMRQSVLCVYTEVAMESQQEHTSYTKADSGSVSTKVRVYIYYSLKICTLILVTGCICLCIVATLKLKWDPPGILSILMLYIFCYGIHAISHKYIISIKYYQCCSFHLTPIVIYTPPDSPLFGVASFMWLMCLEFFFAGTDVEYLC